MQGSNGGQGKEEESRYLASYSRQMPQALFLCRFSSENEESKLNPSSSVIFIPMLMPMRMPMPKRDEA
jgi:hypothetical protein